MPAGFQFTKDVFCSYFTDDVESWLDLLHLQIQLYNLLAPPKGVINPIPVFTANPAGATSVST